MNLLDSITIKGLIIAQHNGLINLPEKKKIPFCEEIIEDFVNRVIEDLFNCNAIVLVNTSSRVSQIMEVHLNIYFVTNLEYICYNLKNK